MCLVSKFKCFLKTPKSLICALSRDAGHCNTRIQCQNWGSKTFHPFPRLPCTPPWSHFSPSLSVLRGCYNEDQHEKAEVHYNQISHPIPRRRDCYGLFLCRHTHTGCPVSCSLQMSLLKHFDQNLNQGYFHANWENRFYKWYWDLKMVYLSLCCFLIIIFLSFKRQRSNLLYINGSLKQIKRF